MNVYEIIARVSRKIQLRDYEPCEAEITMKASVTVGSDDAGDIGRQLMAQCRVLVDEALGERVKSGTEVVAEKAAAKKQTAAEKKKAAAAAKKAEKKASDLPVDDFLVSVDDLRKAAGIAASKTSPTKVKTIIGEVGGHGGKLDDTPEDKMADVLAALQAV